MLSIKRPILDIGCGEGLFAKNVFVEKIDPGMDPTPRELERARKLEACEKLNQTKGDFIDKLSCSYIDYVCDAVCAATIR